MLPSAERFCHSSSPNGFHCHWYFSGCVPVASTESVTFFPGRMSFWLTGWDVTLGDLAARVDENIFFHCVQYIVTSYLLVVV